MPSVTFSGLASGLDTSAIIDALVKASREPIRALERKKSDYDDKLGLYSQLNSRLSSLRSAAREIDSNDDFRSLAATSSDEAKVVATTTGAASVGAYALTVSSLAQAERSYAYTIDDKTATGTVGSGTLTIQVGTDTSVDIAIDESVDSLESVAQKINSAGVEVSASIVFDGTSHRLLVMGTQTGAANAVTFAETGSLATKLGLSDAAAEAQQAQDATVLMDGITFNSETNQLADVIPGVTIELKNTTEADQTVTLKVDLDAEAMEEKLDTFVNAYNSVASFLHQQFQFDGENPVTNTLLGDSAARGVQSRLQAIVASEVSALSGGYSALSRIGITTDADGTLSLDSASFRAALADDPAAVAELFAYSDGDDDTDNDGIAVRLERAADQLIQTPDGVLAARKDGINESIRTIDDRIDTMERNLERYEETLRRQFTAMEQMMAAIQSQGNFLAQQIAALPPIQ
jgi:flagellar hook-associated protein 2